MHLSGEHEAKSANVWRRKTDSQRPFFLFFTAKQKKAHTEQDWAHSNDTASLSLKTEDELLFTYVKLMPLFKKEKKKSE